jgi:hypothetical protein
MNYFSAISNYSVFGDEHFILWHIDPSLGNECETNNKTTVFARQQILNN